MKVYKQYKGVFFDWDGTAVTNRSEVSGELIQDMESLLAQGMKLIIVSGTTYNNIVGGKLHEYIERNLRSNLYMCLGRGAFNYGFDEEGQLIMLYDASPSHEEKVVIDRVAYEFHEWLYKIYNYKTDIVFSRDGYCKIDLIPGYDRGEQLYMNGDEDEIAHNGLIASGINKGVFGCIDYVIELGKKQGINLKVTTDGKYLEVGTLTKSNHIDYMLDEQLPKFGHKVEEYAFWGDEFGYLLGKIKGSDGHMITPKSKNADFFSVSTINKPNPKEVNLLGGGTKTFQEFLKCQKK